MLRLGLSPGLCILMGRLCIVNLKRKKGKGMPLVHGSPGPGKHD